MIPVVNNEFIISQKENGYKMSLKTIAENETH